MFRCSRGGYGCFSSLPSVGKPPTWWWLRFKEPPADAGDAASARRAIMCQSRFSPCHTSISFGKNSIISSCSTLLKFTNDVVVVEWKKKLQSRTSITDGGAASSS